MTLRPLTPAEREILARTVTENLLAREPLMMKGPKNDKR